MTMIAHAARSSLRSFSCRPKRCKAESQTERIAEEEEKDNNLKIMDLRRELHCTTGPAGCRSATKGGDEKRMAWLERAWSGLLRARAAAAAEGNEKKWKCCLLSSRGRGRSVARWCSFTHSPTATATDRN